MKKLLFCFIVFGTLAACKKTYTCTQHYIFGDNAISFIGFDSSDVNPVIIEHYKANSQFNTWLQSDTIDGSTLYYRGDTILKKTADTSNYNTPNGIVLITVDRDFKIRLPRIHKEYHVTEVSKGKTSFVWYREEPCGGGRSFFSC